MKRLFTFFLAIALCCSLTACGSRNPVSDSAAETETSEIAAGTDSTTETEDLEPVVSDAADNHILIAYFSRWGNTEYSDDVDATTSASIVPGNDRFGTTEYVARMIQQEVGGDLHLIKTATPYTTDFDELCDVNHEEMADNVLPELEESDLDISAYDTVFIGYPIWAMDAPQAVLSFLNTYDLSGKTVIPFCTHGGYGAGSSYSTIESASGASQVLEGLAVEADDVRNAEGTVTDWLLSIGFSGQQDGAVQNTGTPIKITVGDVVLDGVLYDSPLAQEIQSYFPLTISMSDFGGREYYGGVDFYPENSEAGSRNFEDGDISYCEAHHNMGIFYAQSDNPTLSVEVTAIGKVTSDLSVFETFGSREEITFSLAE